MEGLTPPITFTVPGAAVGKGRARSRIAQGKAGQFVAHYTPQATVRWENLVKTEAAKAMAGRAPFAGAVALDLTIWALPPASWSGKKRRQAVEGEIRPTTKPDADNVLKAVADACNAVVFVDDKQCVEVTVRKWYGERAATQVTVREIGAEQAPQAGLFAVA